MTSGAHVLGFGLACPLGLHARSALAAMRAGISRFAEVDGFVGPGGPVRASRLAQISPDSSRVARATMLARHAVREAAGRTAAPVACFLALPDPMFGPRIDPDRLLHDLADDLNGLRLVLHPPGAGATGRAGVFTALTAALHWLDGGTERRALVGGIDSLVDLETLDALAADDRLLGATNLDGAIPGEAAAFVLLGGPSASTRPQPGARIVALATGHDARPRDRADATIDPADGLTAVFRQLRAAFPHRVDRVHAGITGQTRFGREFSFAYLRNAPLLPEPLHCEPLGQALGDVGAAAGAVSLVQAVASLGPGEHALVYASSDDGGIGAAVLAG